MQKSAIWHRKIRHQGIVNGRYVAEVDADTELENDHGAGTLVCEPATHDDGDDMTFSYQGVRYMDNGNFTPRI